MDDPDLGRALFALAFGAPIAGMGVASWLGKFRVSSDPESFVDRLYLVTPIAVGFVLIGLGGLADVLFGVPSVVHGLVYGGFALLVMGMVVNLWQPEWLRPGWQRRAIEAKRGEGS